MIYFNLYFYSENTNNEETGVICLNHRFAGNPSAETGQVDYSLKAAEFLRRKCENGAPPLAFVHSFGCQQNVNDGEKLRGMLAEIGYGFTDTPENADLVIFNTCAVRENAEDRVFGNIGQLKKCKEQNPDLIIGVCGCMVEQSHISEKIRKSYPYVSMVFGTHALYRFPELLYRELTTRKRIFDAEQEDGAIVEGVPVKREDPYKAYVPVMYGCNNFCSYCIVPYVRGRERSRRPEDILAEVRGLVADGYKEIMLLGQNVNSYGKGLERDITFAELLRQVDAVEGDFRIRFMTSHPKDATHELIDAIADCKKVCKHLHLPVQCGSNRILSLMNRHYTKADYLDLIRYAKQKIPGLALSSDIIVGFPGETYEDFKETLELLKEVDYHLLYTFIYSRREGTKAAVMDDPVPAKEKSRWFQELLEVQRECSVAHNKSYVGQTLRVLADSVGKYGDGYLSGRTEHNVIVDFKGDKELIGSFVSVKITGALNWALVGEKI